MQKVYKANDPDQPSFLSSFKVTKRWEGNCSEIAKNSNKFYHIEIQVASNGQARICTIYGRVGKDGVKEFRYYPGESSCLRDYEALISKKRDRKKDPYREVDLAITSVGSEGAKQIKKPMTGIEQVEVKSNLHKEVQRLVSGWFGQTGSFVEMNLKCPLGQLTKEQIDKGRVVLDDCKSLVNSKNNKASDNEWDIITSQFYSIIPHVLPHKIDAAALRLNSIDRIMEKYQMLDTFLDAKNVANVLSKGSSVDDQYLTLKANVEWMDPKDPVSQWIEKLFFETRAKNHSGLGKIKIYNIFKILRNGEDSFFLNTAETIGKDIKGKLEKPRYTTLERPDLSKEERVVFTKSNVWPLWHGTRVENMVGIISRGLLIRPSGVVYCGCAFGSGIYFAENSTKSCGYTGCKGAYWSSGVVSDRAYLFLNDVIVGNPHIVYDSQYFQKPPKGTHSVYALPGRSLYNSENITYAQSGSGQQHQLRYIIEFQSNQ